MSNVHLSGVPLADLSREARRRGYDLIPAGVFAANLVEMERLHALHSEHDPQLFDGRAVVEQLGRMAREDLPRAVEWGTEQAEEARRLRSALERTELEAGLLAAVTLKDELGDLERGSATD